VAHEIGHYCAMRRFNLRPRSRAAYWELEKACNDFAARLLVADADLELAGTWSEPRQLLHAIRAVQRRCKVSLAVAARRFPEASPAVSVSFFTLPRLPTEGCVAVAEWCVESRPWLRYGPRAHVDGSDIAARLLATVVTEPAGATKLVEDDNARAAIQRLPRGILIAGVVGSPLASMS
jgi:hypothetical protein